MSRLGAPASAPSRPPLAPATDRLGDVLDVEQALLGALLLNNHAFEHVADLSREVFSSELHAEIFAAIKAEISAGNTADLVTVGERLCRAGYDGGVVGYLARIAAAVPSAARAALYAEKLRERAIGDWPEPQALVATFDPKPYPTDALPNIIRAAVEEVQGFVQAPVPLVANCAIGAVSTAIQGLVDVRRADRLEGPTSVFVLTIADSGERKSTCDELFFASIRAFEQEQEAAARPLLARHAAALEAWTAKREGIKARIRDCAKNDEPTAELERALEELEAERPAAPRLPRLLRVDETPEHLVFALAHEWPSGAIVAAEGGLVFGSHAMGRDSIMRALALLNALWSGEPIRIGRRTAESFTVRGARLTVAIQAQEETLRAFVERTDGLARGSGFLSRFLIAWPRSTQGTRRFREPPASWPALSRFNRRIRELLEHQVKIDHAGALVPTTVDLTPEARSAWIAVNDAIERELREGGELADVRDAASKAADNVARLAALFQVFERGIGPVSAEAVAAASRIVGWCLSESRRFLGETALPAELANAARLDAWLRAYCRERGTQWVPRREVQRAGPARLRDGRALDEALRVLAEADRVRESSEGRRRHVIVNPRLLSGQ